jgi:murein DD-endopeptidase MepM/ murein hydrolase activator NlpD
MTGTDVDQYANPRTRLSLRHRTRHFGARLATTDGRWALVSSSLTIMVAGVIGWMAMGTLSQVPAVRPNHTALPYELFLRLVQAGGAQQLASIAPQFAPQTQDQQAAQSVSDVESRTLTLDSGDTLAGAMEDAGVSSADANAAITALGKDFNPRSLKAGMNFDITYNIAPTIDATGTPPAPKTTVVMVNHKPVTVPVEEDSDAGATARSSQPISRLLSLHFSPTIEQDVTVTRDLSGAFTAQNDQKVLNVHHHRAGATIDSSLYLAGMQAGIPADIVVEMIRMFSYKVDFQRDLQPGDSFEVYYDYYYTPDGKPAKTGNISYARMHLNGKDVVLYRYAPTDDQTAEYFDTKGQSAKGMLMKTPVDGARISSGFGSRLHPILGYTRMHKGVDFAVPTGTPVMAAGAGTISFMGWANGYGNFVIINHSNNYATAYGHLSRFAPGMKRGAHVSQGEVFAYSGMTGLATGPHLHYEIRINGTQVNPLTVKIADGRQLTGAELSAFLQQRLKMDAILASTTLETKVSDNTTDLRQAKSK